jgi:hypothetical protein
MLRVKKAPGIILKLDFEKAYDRVAWEFLEEVLMKKGFHPVWIKWVKRSIEMDTLLSISMGSKGLSFVLIGESDKGTLLSPLLFDFVLQALPAMIDSARRTGHLTGLDPELVEGGVNLLQYADGTVILLGHSDSNILHLKFLLHCFKSMSGMKINYHKSEVFVLGRELAEQERVANLYSTASWGIYLWCT